MRIDLSLYEEVKLNENFALTSINEGNIEEYQTRLNDMISALNAAAPGEVPNIAWILCWTVCFNEYLDCLLHNGPGWGYLMCMTRYNHCIDNCGPIQA